MASDDDRGLDPLGLLCRANLSTATQQAETALDSGGSIGT